MAQWLEITLPAHGDPDALCDRLTELGFDGFVVEDETDFHRFLAENTQYWDFVDDALTEDFRGVSAVKLWLEDTPAAAPRLELLRQNGFAPAVKIVRDADWENNWREFYRPLEIGERLIVVPEWEDYAGHRVRVTLDPGLLFGTGQHATTHMCLEAAERCVTPGCAVLDLGCGSGILGIAAAALGAASVRAADIDPKAPDIVGANAALNGCGDKFTVLVGDVTRDKALRAALGRGQVVFANIVADVLIALAPYAPQLLEDGGTLICSGIIDGREDEVLAALTGAGLTLREHNTREEWHCLRLEK